MRIIYACYAYIKMFMNFFFCFPAGTEIRIVNGNYATDTGKPNAGKSTIIKTLVNSYSSFGMS